MQIKTVKDFYRALERGPYADGGYPCYFVMKDGEPLSYAAARENDYIIAEAIRDGYDAQWLPVAYEINWEDEHLVCSLTYLPIPCAYPAD